MGAYLYAVGAQYLYRVDDTGIKTVMTGNLLTYSGPVWMADNGTQLMIVDGLYGYILSGTTLTRITDADFPTPSSLSYQDGYFIVSSSGTGQFFISASYDGTSWDALDYATAETSPDGLLCVISANRELWLIGSRSYEVWYNSGNASFPFERINGAYNSIGCLAAHSVAQREGIVCWLDDNKQVRATNGYQVTKISTEQIDYQIGQYYIVNDAIGFFYSQEGHTFYVLTFPNAGKTWVYDFTTQLWHTRASGETDLRHRANCYAYYYYANKHVVGDYENGKLYYYDYDKFTDDGEVIRRVRAAQAVHADRKMVRHKSLEIEFESGVGLANNDADIASGTDPQAMLQWSDDGGHTWSNEYWRDMGARGKYQTRARWFGLGQSRDRVYRVTITDPVKVVMIGAYLEAEGGK